MYKTKTTKCHNELKPTENELNINSCKCILYLNHFNESKLLSFSLFYGKIKSVCELRHTFFIKLWLRQI